MQRAWLGALLLLISCHGAPDPVSPAEDQIFRLRGDYAASHIQIAYKGAERAAGTVTRSREEALQLARDLAAQLAAEPARFSDLARTNSDDASASRGGWLGSWEKGHMAPELEAAVASLDEHQITETPVETAFGFHLIRREPIALRHYGADGFFIAYADGTPATAGITRDKTEAEQLAMELAARTTPKNFDQLAGAHNDRGNGPVFMGVFTEKDPLPAEVISTLAGLGFGAVAGPIDFPMGYAVVRRVRLEQRAASHVLIAHRDASGSRAIRTREEARALTERLLAELEGGRDFEDLARQHSDGPTASHGGLLGTWFRGNMVPEFEAAVDSLAVGEVTREPVETAFGFHIIRRDAPRPDDEPDLAP